MPAPHTSTWDHLALIHESPEVLEDALARLPDPHDTPARRLGRLLRHIFVPGPAHGRTRAAAAFTLGVAVRLAAVAGTVVTMAGIAGADIPRAIGLPAGIIFIAWTATSMLTATARDLLHTRERRALCLRRRRLAAFRGRGPTNNPAASELAARTRFWRGFLQSTRRHLSAGQTYADPGGWH